MVLKTHTWISGWFLFVAPVIVWDICYFFLRPRSMKGGDLQWIWGPAYAMYEEVDYIYGVHSFEAKAGFPKAQALMNIIETLSNMSYVYLTHIAKWPPAPIIGLGGALMTFSKGMIYGMQEYYCDYCNVGHNTMWDYFFLWVLPGVVWTTVPLVIALQLGKDLAASVNIAAQLNEKGANGKQN